MYFPYLRGKQFELIALREFAADNAGNRNIIPIIEPVKATYNSLSTAIAKLIACDIMFALVLNPEEGDFNRETPDIVGSIAQLNDSGTNWMPAYILNGRNSRDIIQTIKTAELTNVMLICKNSVDIADADTKELIELNNVIYIVCGADNSRSVNKKLRDLGKHLIRLDDKFNNQKKNADYLTIPEELFTDEHHYFRDDHYFGFSDYTTLSKDFIDGGMLPYAIAIHLTYEKTPEEVWVKHFVSDTNDSPSNIHGKFFEAASKARDFFMSKDDKTPAINELISIVKEERYPGLGVIKKISIRNHIELINRLLTERQ